MKTMGMKEQTPVSHSTFEFYQVSVNCPSIWTRQARVVLEKCRRGGEGGRVQIGPKQDHPFHKTVVARS